MEANFKFEKLHIWNTAMDLGEEINKLSAKFPQKEIYNLTSQICRAGDSVALNISEGSILQSNPEQKKFVGYAIRSLAEVVTCLYKAKRRKYISEPEFEKQYSEAFHLMNMMVAFRNKIGWQVLGDGCGMLGDGCGMTGIRWRQAQTWLFWSNNSISSDDDDFRNKIWK